MRHIEAIIEWHVDNPKLSRRVLKCASDADMEQVIRDQVIMAAHLFGRRLAEMIQWLENAPEARHERVALAPMHRGVRKRPKMT